MRNKDKTHCPQGHEYSLENTHLYTIGHYTRRFCRTCAIERTREYRNRQKNACASVDQEVTSFITKEKPGGEPGHS